MRADPTEAPRAVSPFLTATAATAATANFGELCPLCDKHCPLDAPSCGKGRRLAAQRRAGE
jgi:hypothetical protein